MGDSSSTVRDRTAGVHQASRDRHVQGDRLLPTCACRGASRRCAVAASCAVQRAVRRNAVDTSPQSDDVALLNRCAQPFRGDTMTERVRSTERAVTKAHRQGLGSGHAERISGHGSTLRSGVLPMPLRRETNHRQCTLWGLFLQIRPNRPHNVQFQELAEAGRPDAT